MNAILTMRRLSVILTRYAFRYGDEAQLHQGIMEAFTKEGMPFEHEKILEATGDRFDFYVENGVVVEVKSAGSQADALRQINRYCMQPEVNGILLVTTKPWRLYSQHRDERGVMVAGEAIRELHGKPIQYVQVKGQSF